MFSLVRQVPFLAADLSTAYIANVNKLTIIYKAKIKGGVRAARTEAPTMPRKKAEAMIGSKLFIRLVCWRNLSPAKAALAARGLSCLSGDKV